MLFRSSLHLTRFNNQGVDISNPIASVNVTTRDGESFVLRKDELKNFYNEKDLINVKSNIVSIRKKFLDLATANVSRVKKEISKTIGKIKGFIS